MYDRDFIQSHNEDTVTYNAVYGAAVRSRERGCGFRERMYSSSSDKCAIHFPPMVNELGTGCSLVKGYHSSIRAMRFDPPLMVCHAEEGARVIDAELAKEMILMSDDFVVRANERGVRFSKRYMSGSFVDWKAYGNGYCYLQLVDPGMRHRVARIIGPNPFVWDVIRTLCVCADWESEKGFALDKVGEELYHVVSTSWTPATSIRSFLERIQGLGHESKIGASVGIVDRMRGLNFNDNIPSFDYLKGHVEKMSRKRICDVVEWCESLDIRSHDERLLCCLMLVTVGGNMISLDGSKSRTIFRVWQLLGDVVAKQYACFRVMHEGLTTMDYSNDVTVSQSNKTLAMKLKGSPLFYACDAAYVDSSSKVLANIVESVVGVVALFCDESAVVRVLKHFDILPSEGGVEIQKVEHEDLSELKLNSSQLSLVIKMKADGLLG